MASSASLLQIIIPPPSILVYSFMVGRAVLFNEAILTRASAISPKVGIWASFSSY